VDRVLDRSNPRSAALVRGGELNTCENALDVHVESAAPISWRWSGTAPSPNQTVKYTYRELLQETARFAGALRRVGVGKGEPRGHLHADGAAGRHRHARLCAPGSGCNSVVFGGFAAHELAARIEHATPRAIVCGSCGLEPGRTVPYKPMVTRRSPSPSTSPRR